MRSPLKHLFVTILLAAVIGSGSLVPANAQAATTTGQNSGFAPTSSMLLWGTDAELAHDLDTVVATGAKWIRFDFDWQSAEPNRGAYNWRFIDRVVAAANARGLRIIATAAYTPTWARPSGTSDKVPPTDPTTYATFVGAAVRRYAPQGVKHWEIWNEPNIHHFWKPKPDATAYARLLKLAATAVRDADPDAFIISAGLAPAADAGDGTYVSPRTFLQRVYDQGAASSFDAVGMHPYAFPYDVMEVHDSNQFWSLPKTYDVMVRNGDGDKKIWGTEFGAPTGTNSQAVTDEGQAYKVTSGYGQWVQWQFTGPLLWYGVRDFGSDLSNVEHNFGMVRRNLTAKPSLAEYTRIMRQSDPRGSVVGDGGAAAPAPTTTTTAPATTTTTTAPTATTTTTTTTTPAPTASPGGGGGAEAAPGQTKERIRGKKLVSMASACPETVDSGAFADVTAANVHSAGIDCLAWWGVTSGRNGGYAPGDTMTRGQLATFMVGAIGATAASLPEAQPTSFLDIEDSVHRIAIERLATAGILTGRTAQAFEPDGVVSRAQVASVAVRAYEHVVGGTLEPAGDHFTDDGGSPHEEGIDKAAALGLVQGTGEGRFSPMADVRRDQAATIVVRLLAVLVEAGRSELPA